MKRRRGDMEKGESELRLAMEELSVFSSEGEKEEKKQSSSTLDLLCVSKKLLHILDEIGPTLLVLRQDIQQNVERLEELHTKDPSKYASLTEIVTDEVEEGTSKKAESCTRAIVWLARSINFSLHLLEILLKSPELSLKEIVEEAYISTLKPWHGWISSAAYKLPTAGSSEARSQERNIRRFADGQMPGLGGLRGRCKELDLHRAASSRRNQHCFGEV